MRSRFKLRCQAPTALFGFDNPVQKEVGALWNRVKSLYNKRRKRAINGGARFGRVQEKFVALNTVSAQRDRVADAQPDMAKQEDQRTQPLRIGFVYDCRQKTLTGKIAQLK
jgi:hypothetical protein